MDFNDFVDLFLFKYLGRFKFCFVCCVVVVDVFFCGFCRCRCVCFLCFVSLFCFLSCQVPLRGLQQLRAPLPLRVRCLDLKNSTWAGWFFQAPVATPT